MITPIPFDPARFRSAAPHYLSGRPSYAPTLIARVAQICGLNGSRRLLDLGCGPGVLAMALAPYVADVLAIDPEPEMLAEGQKLAAGLAVKFTQGSSLDITPDWGRFAMVAIGRAFHWMDRVAVPRALDALVEPGGAVVLFRTDHPDVPDNAWRVPYHAVIDSATGAGQRAAWRRPGWVSHEAVLLDGPFCVLERVGVIERVRTPSALMIDRALSMSSSTQTRLGTGVAALRASVAAAVAAATVDGLVTEVVESVALIARRP